MNSRVRVTTLNLRADTARSKMTYGGTDPAEGDSDLRGEQSRLGRVAVDYFPFFSNFEGVEEYRAVTRVIMSMSHLRW